MIKFSIVIPCYNEGANIPLLIDKLKNDCLRSDLEIILVDNGSTDGSSIQFNKIINADNFIKVTRVDKNIGYGHGIQAGLALAQGEFIGWTHADLQTDPKDILKCIKILEVNADNQSIYVKGLRKNRPFFDRLFTYGMSLFETILFKKNLYDINAQPNLFHRSLYERWKNAPEDFSLDLFAFYMARSNNIKVIRVDVLFPKRIHGVSSWNTSFSSKLKFIKRTLGFSFNLKKRMNL